MGTGLSLGINNEVIEVCGGIRLPHTFTSAALVTSTNRRFVRRFV